MKNSVWVIWETGTHTHTHLAGSSGSWVLCLCVKELWKFNEEHQLMTCYLWPHFLSIVFLGFSLFAGFPGVHRSWLCVLYLDLSSSLNTWLHPVASLGLTFLLLVTSNTCLTDNFTWCVRIHLINLSKKKHHPKNWIKTCAKQETAHFDRVLCGSTEGQVSVRLIVRAWRSSQQIKRLLASGHTNELSDWAGPMWPQRKGTLGVWHTNKCLYL